MAKEDNLTPWSKGQSGNPDGKTSEQKTQELRNAELALRIRGRMLEAMDKAYEGAEGQALVDKIDPQSLKMLKDAEDRGLGAPVQKIAGGDGGALVTEVRYSVIDPPKRDE